MKYYKFLGNEINGKLFDSLCRLEKDRIYPEDFEYDKTTISFFAIDEDTFTKTAYFFQEVPEIEYLLQKAKKDYPIGTVVNSVYGLNKVKLINLPFIRWNEIHCKIDMGDCTIYSENKWAKIVKDEFVLPDEWFILLTKENEQIVHNWKCENTGYKANIKANGEDSISYYGTWSSKKHFKSSNYTEITFEQFKTHVLKSEEKMEKKIIGYKLIKPEYQIFYEKLTGTRNLERLADSLGDLLWVDQAVKVMKEAGVLDLWFEPVYEEKFKIGDWVIVDHNDWKYGTVQLINTNNKAEYKCNKWSWDKNSIYGEVTRLATPEEIKATQTPDIKINSYKAEFFENYVKFGCAEISKEVFIDLHTCREYKNTNRDVEKVTIGKGEFTKEQIKEIVEYYKNKK